MSDDPWAGVTPATRARLESAWEHVSHPDRVMSAFRVSWTPGAALLTPEQRAAELANWLEAIVNGKVKPIDTLDSHLPQQRFSDAFGEPS